MLKRLSFLLLLVVSFTTQADVVSFQQGVNGYSGTVDTFIFRADPASSYGSNLAVFVQDTPQIQALIRFDDIVGNGANQVALGSSINSVTVTFHNFNPGTDMGANRLLEAFDNTVTYNGSYGGDGVSADDIEGSSQTVGFSGALGPQTTDITALVSCWFDASCANEGIVLSHFVATIDAVGFHSSEFSNINLRPILTVDFNPTSVPGPGTGLLFALALAGLFRRR